METEGKSTSRGNIGEDTDDAANIDEQPETGCACCGNECHIEWTDD